MLDTELEWPISMTNKEVEMGILKAVLVFIPAMLIPKFHLAAENLALRRQLAVYKQSVKRPKIRPCDRIPDTLRCTQMSFLVWSGIPGRSASARVKM